MPVGTFDIYTAEFYKALSIGLTPAIDPVLPPVAHRELSLVSGLSDQCVNDHCQVDPVR